MWNRLKRYVMLLRIFLAGGGLKSGVPEEETLF